MSTAKKLFIALFTSLFALTAGASTLISPARADGDTGNYVWVTDPNNPGSQILVCPSGQCTISIPPMSNPPSGGSSSDSSMGGSTPTPQPSPSPSQTPTQQQNPVLVNPVIPA